LLYPEARKLSGFFIEKKPPSSAARNGYTYCGTALVALIDEDLRRLNRLTPRFLLSARLVAEEVEIDVEPLYGRPALLN